jgi:magnesium-transporting ATPase (P-type)
MTFLIFFGKLIWGFDYERNDRRFDSSNNPTGKAKHFTILFNTFVFMHIFNEVNCRKVGATSFNIFAGILSNWLFLAVLAAVVVLQYCFVTYIPRIFDCVRLDGQ